MNPVVTKVAALPYDENWRRWRQRDHSAYPWQHKNVDLKKKKKKKKKKREGGGGGGGGGDRENDEWERPNTGGFNGVKGYVSGAYPRILVGGGGVDFFQRHGVWGP